MALAQKETLGQFELIQRCLERTRNGLPDFEGFGIALFLYGLTFLGTFASAYKGELCGFAPFKNLGVLMFCGTVHRSGPQTFDIAMWEPWHAISRPELLGHCTSIAFGLYLSSA